MTDNFDTPARKRTLQSDKYNLHYLKFFGEFLEREGLTTTTAGEKIGLTQVSVYYWLKKDDARLSAIAKIIEACGYRLIIDYVDPSPSSYEIITDQNRPQRLSFLAEALSGANKAMVADSLGLGETTVYYWLSHDDIFISYIFKIADILGKKVRIMVLK